MTKKELMKVDIGLLNPKAKRLYEESDLGGLEVLFGNCKDIDDINRAGEEMYDEFFEEM